MGLILDRITEAGPFGAEVRGQSAYILGENPNWRSLGDPEPKHSIWVHGAGKFAINADDLAGFIGVLDQIMGESHTGYSGWLSDHQPDGDWAVERFEIPGVGEALACTGKFWSYGATEGEWVNSGVIELGYANAAALRTALAAA